VFFDFSFFPFLSFKICAMENPFEIIEQRLDAIEQLLKQIKYGIPSSELGKNVMNVRELSKYLGLSLSDIYKKTSSNVIPFYKRGKMIYFKRTEIDDWLTEFRQSTRSEIEQEAADYLIKHKMRKF